MRPLLRCPQPFLDEQAARPVFECEASIAGCGQPEPANVASDIIGELNRYRNPGQFVMCPITWKAVGVKHHHCPVRTLPDNVVGDLTAAR